jgi:hypothetical protein
MQKPQFIPYFLVLTPVLIFLTGCGTKEPAEEYPAEIKTVDGVKVVTNPDFPKEGTIHYEMEEELSIGVMEGDEEYMLNRPQDVKVSEDGTIYIYDMGDVCIKVYDENGAYLRTLGQQGQGPGEFGYFIYMALSSDDRIFILDAINQRIFTMDIYGKYLRGFRVEGIHREMKTDDQNRIYFSKRIQKTAYEDLPVTKDFQEIEMVNQIIRCNPDGSEQFVIGEFKGEIEKVKRTKTGGGISLSSQYNIVWEISREGMLYEGLNDQYKIHIFNPDGTKVMTFSGEYKPVTREFRRDGEVVNKRVMPAFDFRKGLKFDGEGNLWVAVYSENEDDNVYDVFSPDGIYIKQVIVHHRIFELSKGKAYSIVATEEGFPQVKRFKLVTPALK